MFISIKMCGVCGAGIPTKFLQGAESVTLEPFGKCYWYLYSLGTAYTFITCMHLLGANKVQNYTKKKKKGTAPVTFVSFFFLSESVPYGDQISRERKVKSEKIHWGKQFINHYWLIDWLIDWLKCKNTEYVM